MTTQQRIDIDWLYLRGVVSDEQFVNPLGRYPCVGGGT